MRALVLHTMQTILMTAKLLMTLRRQLGNIEGGITAEIGQDMEIMPAIRPYSFIGYWSVIGCKVSVVLMKSLLTCGFYYSTSVVIRELIGGVRQRGRTRARTQ